MKIVFTFLLLIQSLFLFSQEWEQVQSVPDNYRTDHSYGFSIDGVGYLVSGNSVSGLTADFYSYDAEADQWSKKDDFPGQARGFAIGDVVDGKAYFGFGSNGNSALNDFWEYDPVSDEWTQLAFCDCDARTHPAMVALDGFIYVGLGGGGGNKKDWWAYDIANDSWEQRADFPAARRHHPYQFHDGEYVYVGNGHGDNTAEGLFISNEWYRYDTMNDTWEQVATMPAEGRVAGTQLSHKGAGYVLSGDGDNHSFMDTGELWKYDAEIDSWIQLPPHPGRSRWAPASFIINDEVYIINGWNGADGFLDNVYKLDLTPFIQPRLRTIMPDLSSLTYERDEMYCDVAASAKIEVNTPLAFDVDADITLSVDPASTAIEGRDFILNETSGTLVAGELASYFDITFFNDRVVSGDKTLIINLASNQEVEIEQTSLTIPEDDIAFDTSVSNGSAVVGLANTSNPNVFGQYYTNMITQSIYRKEILDQYGLAAGQISQMSMEVLSKGSTNPYQNFTVYMANTDADALVSGINQTLNFTEVYRGSFSTFVGVNEIIFDTPFEYDGESNLAIQYCFDNNGFTNDDFVAAFDVNYNSTATLKIDNVSGCPSNGNQFNTTSLPVITFGEGKAAALYSDLNGSISSTIDAGDQVYFSQNDSILMNISADINNVQDCFSASLVSNTNEILGADLSWQDKIYYLENNSSDNQYEITLILPNFNALKWDSPELLGLYSDTEVSPGEIPTWETIEITEVIENEPYVFVTMPYVGTGSYTVGGAVDITSTIDIDKDLIYDTIEYYDIVGRRVNINENLLNDDIKGIYLKTYKFKGSVVKTEKILR